MREATDIRDLALEAIEGLDTAIDALQVAQEKLVGAAVRLAPSYPVSEREEGDG
jgi:hypothetical protein